MSRIGWSVGQRAAVSRYLLFAGALSVVGVVLSVFLIVSGNNGGWVLLGMIACMDIGAFLFFGNLKKQQP